MPSESELRWHPRGFTRLRTAGIRLSQGKRSKNTSRLMDTRSLQALGQVFWEMSPPETQACPFSLRWPGGAGLQGPGMTLMPAGSFRGVLVPALFSQQWDSGLGSSCARLKPAEILKQLQKEGEKALPALQPLPLASFVDAPTRRPLFPSMWKQEDLEMFHFTEWLQTSSFSPKNTCWGKHASSVPMQDVLGYGHQDSNPAARVVWGGPVSPCRGWGMCEGCCWGTLPTQL